MIKSRIPANLAQLPADKKCKNCPVLPQWQNEPNVAAEDLVKLGYTNIWNPMAAWLAGTGWLRN